MHHIRSIAAGHDPAGECVSVSSSEQALCASTVVAAPPRADEFGHFHGHVAPAALHSFWSVWRIDESWMPAATRLAYIQAGMGVWGPMP